MKKRYAVVDIWKFVFAILFMFLHLRHLGFGTNYFSTAGIYVEFFYIVTGYFTMQHFDKSRLDETWKLEKICKNSITYTIKKFKPIFLYSIPAVLLAALYYAVFRNNIKELLTQFSFPLELLLLVSPFTKNVNYMLPPLWYIAAMMVVFPVFCCLCQSKVKYITYMVAFYISLFYYGYTNASCILSYPHQEMRAFAALCLGVLVYGISGELATKTVSSSVKKMLTVVECGLFIAVIISTYFGWNINVLNLLCLFAGSVLIFSGQSYSVCLRNYSILSYLGKMSFVIYLYHWIVGMFMRDHKISHGIRWYFIGTIILSVAVLFATESIKKKMNQLKRKNKCD